MYVPHIGEAGSVISAPLDDTGVRLEAEAGVEGGAAEPAGRDRPPDPSGADDASMNVESREKPILLDEAKGLVTAPTTDADAAGAFPTSEFPPVLILGLPAPLLVVIRLRCLSCARLLSCSCSILAA